MVSEGNEERSLSDSCATEPSVGVGATRHFEWLKCIYGCKIGEHEPVRCLTCLHFVCSDTCADRLRAETKPGSVLKCNECNSSLTHGIPPEKIIPADIFRRKDPSDEMIVCENCILNHEAVAYCQECAINLCKRCKELHPQTKATRTHIVIDGVEKSGSVEQSNQAGAKCTAHNLDSSFYCVNCDQRYCPKCKINHDGHEVYDLGKAEQDLNLAIEQSGKLTERFNTAIMDIEQKTADMKTTEWDRLNDTINQEFSSMLTVLNSRREKLINEAREKFIQQQAALNIRMKLAETAHESAQRYVILGENVLKNGPVEAPSKFLKHFKGYTDWLEDLDKKMTSNFDSLVDKDMHFKLNTLGEDAVEKFVNEFYQLEYTNAPKSGNHVTTDQNVEVEENQLCLASSSATAVETHDDDVEEVQVVHRRSQRIAVESTGGTQTDANTRNLLLRAGLQKSLTNAKTENVAGDYSTSKGKEKATVSKIAAKNTPLDQGEPGIGKRERKKKSFPEYIDPNETRKLLKQQRADEIAAKTSKRKSTSKAPRLSPQITNVWSLQTHERINNSSPPLLDVQNGLGIGSCADSLSAGTSSKSPFFKRIEATSTELIPLSSIKVENDPDFSSLPEATYSSVELPPLEVRYPLNQDDGRNQNGDEQETYCAICYDDSDENLYCCDYCPKVFHAKCHLPIIKTEIDTSSFQCNYSTSKEVFEESIASCPKLEGAENLPLLEESNKYNFLYACKFVMECYKIKSIPTLRWVFTHGYLETFGKVPYHLKYIRERLCLCIPEPFKSVQDMLLAFRQMFIQAFRYYSKKKTLLDVASICWKDFLDLVREYYPQHEGLFADVIVPTCKNLIVIDID